MISDSPLIRQQRYNEKQQRRKDFKTFDRDSLSAMDDRSLAEWQSGYTHDEPQWRLAEHEWQRRLNAEMIAATIKSARGQAWFGIAGVIMGVALTLLLTLISRWLLS